MACCCTSLPYFGTGDRQLYAISSDADDQLMYDDDADDDAMTPKHALVGGGGGESDVDDIRLLAPCAGGFDDAGGPLLNDCMWSAGMLPPDLKAPAPATSRHGSGVGDSLAEDADVDVCAAVDPSLVSPCPPRQPVTSPPGARHVTLTPPHTDPSGSGIRTRVT